MHRVLLIPEVLLNVFCRCAFSRVKRDLAALARTCRAFKEPALDILWSELEFPTPLSRCLPEISHCKVIQDQSHPQGVKKIYTFSRPLERAEWDILRSYARRIWWIEDSRAETLDWEFVRRTSMDFPPIEPLFPNLRCVDCELTQENKPFLLLPFPSLIRLEIGLSLELDPHMLQDPLRSLAEKCLNIKRLGIWASGSSLTYDEIVSEAIYSWSNLCRVVCPEICLDADAFIHLSRMPALTEISCTLSATFLDHTTPSGSLVFATLDDLYLHAVSLVSSARLLSWARLPLITDFTITFESCPTKEDFAYFMAGLQLAGIGHTVEKFCLEQELVDPEIGIVREPNTPLLDFDELRPCMVFHNLISMKIGLQWDVDCSDSKLLALTSAWPQLEELAINAQWGWNGPGGITPDGIAALLQTCPSLDQITLAIDTRGYTESPDRKCRKLSKASYWFRINVLDSIIEQESVDAMATFLSSIVPHLNFTFIAWEAWPEFEHPDLELYQSRWKDVYKKAQEAVEKRWLAQTRKTL